MKPSLFLATLLLITPRLCAATVIINETTLNGGFESGDFSPWGGGSIVSDPVGAYSGSWYAETVATVNRAALFQFFPAATTDQKDFRLTFSARTELGGFLTASGYLFARRLDSSFLNAVVVDSDVSALSEDWSQFSYTFRFDESWDTSQNMSVGVNFNGGSSGDKGFLDSVDLTQVPEPSAACLLITSLLFFSFRRNRIIKEANKASHHNPRPAPSRILRDHYHPST